MLLFLFIIMLSGVSVSLSQDTLETSALKLQSLEDLMDMKITSASKRSERAFDVPASVYVITREDIRRSGATSIPEVLRLAPTIDVAQIDARQWAISIRGFNSPTANKLLVLIDGRSIYTPLYSGILWDAQHIFLEDVDRIEVISGPGATIWGANAVNGVINIITKSAEKNSSQGLLMTEHIGSQEQSFAGIRYGGSISENSSLRIYALTHDRDDLRTRTGNGTKDAWSESQAGFRFDYDGENEQKVTFQGDIYKNAIAQNGNKNGEVSGGNVLGRWTRTFEDRSNMNFQFYFDNTYRFHPLIITQALTTYDIDFQHQFPLGEVQDITWGVGFRYMNDRLTHSVFLAALPDDLLMRLYSGFLQYQYTFAEQRGKFIIGSKFEHNDFSGYEYQPSAKALWSFNSHNRIWGSISRAVRTPARWDRDLFLPGTSPYIVAGGPGILSEKVISYELGFRSEVMPSLGVECAFSYNIYDDLKTLEPGHSPSSPLPFIYENGMEGTTYGMEFLVNNEVTDWWSWKIGFTYLHKDIRLKSWSVPTNLPDVSRDAPVRGTIISHFTLPGDFEIDITSRIVDERENPAVTVPSYVEMDLRLGYKITDNISTSLVGQNLFHDQHLEIVNTTAYYEIPRSVYAKVVLKY